MCSFLCSLASILKFDLENRRTQEEHEEFEAFFIIQIIYTLNHLILKCVKNGLRMKKKRLIESILNKRVSFFSSLPIFHAQTKCAVVMLERVEFQWKKKKEETKKMYKRRLNILQ